MLEPSHELSPLEKVERLIGVFELGADLSDPIGGETLTYLSLIEQRQQLLQQQDKLPTRSPFGLGYPPNAITQGPGTQD